MHVRLRLGASCLMLRFPIGIESFSLYVTHPSAKSCVRSSLISCRKRLLSLALFQLQEQAVAGMICVIGRALPSKQGAVRLSHPGPTYSCSYWFTSCLTLCHTTFSCALFPGSHLREFMLALNFPDSPDPSWSIDHPG